MCRDKNHLALHSITVKTSHFFGVDSVKKQVRGDILLWGILKCFCLCGIIMPLHSKSSTFLDNFYNYKEAL